MPISEEAIVRSELRWAAISVGVVSVIMLALIYAGLVHHINPPSNIERIDPKTLHLGGEFTESNLGTRVAADGQVTSADRRHAVRVPAALHRAAGQPAVTLRFASPDVIHGILVTGTNVNTMVVPGYVSQVHTVFTQHRRPADAVPRILRPRPQPDVGDGARGPAGPIQARRRRQGFL